MTPTEALAIFRQCALQVIPLKDASTFNAAHGAIQALIDRCQKMDDEAAAKAKDQAPST